MKKKASKFMAFALVLAVALMSPITAFAESSSRVGEYVPLNSGSAADTSGGTSNNSTLTERERQAAQTNSTVSRQIRDRIGTLIDSYTVDTGFTLWQDGGYTFVIEQNISPEELRRLIENAGLYDPIGYGYSIPVYTPHTPDLNAGDRSAFRNLVSSLMGGSGNTDGLEIPSITDPLYDLDYIHWTDWVQNGFGDMDEFIDWLLQQGGRRIRVDLDGGFIDFPNMETRYRMLDQYLNATSSTDTIKMQYVLEYRIENTAHNTIYRMVGQNGMNSYTWNFENESTGEAYNRYNQPSAIYHQFMRAGTYDIDVSKDVYKTYCDAFTFSVSEYWIVEETGQVVWKRETAGKDIDPTIPTLELGFRNLVMYNTPDPTEVPSVETVPVAAIRHVVTEDMLNLSIPAESSFREFFTERIQ
jgi:hypothetical protein